VSVRRVPVALDNEKLQGIAPLQMSLDLFTIFGV